MGGDLWLKARFQDLFGLDFFKKKKNLESVACPSAKRRGPQKNIFHTQHEFAGVQ